MSRRLRVLITTSTFPVSPDDGMPRFVLDLATALTEHAEVTVLAPGAPDAVRSERLGALAVHRFSYFFPRRAQMLALGRGMRDNLRASWLARLQVVPFVVRQALHTRRLLRSGAIDVVNAHWMVPQGLTSAWACARAGKVPLVVHVHAGDVYLLQRLPFGRRIARYVVQRARRVLADGSHVRDSLDTLLGYPSHAELRPMGVNTAMFAGSEPAKPFTGTPQAGFLVFVGRLVEKKGVIYLLRAMPKVLETEPGIMLVLIGDGPERLRLEAEVRRLGITSRVQLLGRRDHEEIARHLRRCRAAVVPSIIDSRGETEGMPTVVLEGMAAGARVVGSAVDGIPDVLRHAENGWLCREKDPEDLADKIIMALRDSPTSTVTTAAHATAAEHDWARVGEEYAEHLRAAVSVPGSRVIQE